MTDPSGASQGFKGGLVTYWTEAKEQFGVPAEIIERYGVVSDETALAMAKAVRELFGTDLGVGITGVAGPAPEDGRPVGEVHIGLDGGDFTDILQINYPQRREAVKRRAVTSALQLIRRALLARDAAGAH
jgi:PncC family amidohydrolase